MAMSSKICVFRYDQFNCVQESYLRSSKISKSKIAAKMAAKMAANMALKMAAKSLQIVTNDNICGSLLDSITKLVGNI